MRNAKIATGVCSNRKEKTQHERKNGDGADSNEDIKEEIKLVIHRERRACSDLNGIVHRNVARNSERLRLRSKIELRPVADVVSRQTLSLSLPTVASLPRERRDLISGIAVTSSM